MVKERARYPASYGESVSYKIRIEGELDDRWSEWFNGIEITSERSDRRFPLTTLICPAMDQAKLRGILNKLWDLNLNLVSVRQVQDPASGEAAAGGGADPNGSRTPGEWRE